MYLLCYSFRSYSNTRNHNRRSPTPASRSASYHSPTRNPQQGTYLDLLHFFLGENDPMTVCILVLSRPSSPATSTRHSTHSSSVASRTVQPKPQQLPNDEQQQTPSTLQVSTFESNQIDFIFSI